MNTAVFCVHRDNPDPRAVKAAGAMLREGRLVAFPTETVYGLGANALDEAAVESIFRAKGRPQDNPLIVHIADAADARRYVRAVPEGAAALFKRFWPGPLTVVLPKSPAVPDIVSAGLDTVGLRMPSHPVALALIRAAGVPVAAPSANVSGRPSPTCAAHVLEDLDGKIDAVVDGGSCDIGVESTVVSLCEDEPVLLRPGRVTPEELISVLGSLRQDDAVTRETAPEAAPRAPGMKYRHYAPRARLILVRGSEQAARSRILAEARLAPGPVGVLCFDGEIDRYPGMTAISYGDRDDALSLAKRLFAALRALDQTGCRTVYARCPDDRGMGLAVYNRILKAAGFEVIDA